MSIDIPEIVDRIWEQKCVFLLGPGLAKNRNGENMRSRLLQYFKEKRLDVEEDLDDLYTCDRRTKTRALDHLQKYCRDHSEPNDSHQQLARIPCHLYISITPDLLMKKALDGYGIDNEFEYYVKDEPAHEVVKPIRDKPLLYNLFGSIENQSSIIFNQWDLIRYLFSIIQEFKLPSNLRDTLKNANYFIFLGFDFEKWYLKLLLKLILEESNFSIATQEESRFNEKLRSFYQRRYGLDFVETNIEEYISGLYDECSKRDLLREEKEQVKSSIQSEIKALVGQDEIKNALERLIEYVEDEEDDEGISGELYNHLGSFNGNERKFRMGKITEETARVNRTKIVDALLDIASNY